MKLLKQTVFAMLAILIVMAAPRDVAADIRIKIPLPSGFTLPGQQQELKSDPEEQSEAVRQYTKRMEKIAREQQIQVMRDRMTRSQAKEVSVPEKNKERNAYCHIMVSKRASLQSRLGRAKLSSADFCGCVAEEKRASDLEETFALCIEKLVMDARVDDAAQAAQ